MKCTIDRAGRFVIPKPIREAAGFQPGVEFTIEYTGGVIVIEPVIKTKLVRRRGLLVATAPGAPKYKAEIVNRMLRRMRLD